MAAVGFSLDTRGLALCVTALACHSQWTLRLCLAHFPGVLRSTGIWETSTVCSRSRHWPPPGSCDFCSEDVSVYAIKLVSLFLCCFWSFRHREKGWCSCLADADLEHEAVRRRGLERPPSLPFGARGPARSGAPGPASLLLRPPRSHVASAAGCRSWKFADRLHVGPGLLPA